MAIFDYFNLNGGMNRLANRMAIPPTEADWIDNLHWQNQQGWSNQNTGCKTMNPTNTLNNGANIVSLFGFLDTYGVYQTLAQAGNQLYKIDPPNRRYFRHPRRSFQFSLPIHRDSRLVHCSRQR